MRAIVRVLNHVTEVTIVVERDPKTESEPALLSSATSLGRPPEVSGSGLPKIPILQKRLTPRLNQASKVLSVRGPGTCQEHNRYGKFFPYPPQMHLMTLELHSVRNGNLSF